MAIKPGELKLPDWEWVSIDVETTGLSPERDSLIEVGAVRFRGEETLDTFSSLIKPPGRVGEYITELTGITDADLLTAPPASSVLPQLASFLGSTPLIGHNIKFDIDFLDAAGLTLTNLQCDTWELAYVLIPGSKSYSLGHLTKDLGASNSAPHRALGDAKATAEVFSKLARIALGLEVDIVTEWDSLARRSGSPMSHVTSGLLEAMRQIDREPATGFDMDEIRSRIKTDLPFAPVAERKPVEAESVAAALRDGGSMARHVPGFEHRPQQVEMAQAVAETINQSVEEEDGRLIVEAGTGVGKSLAYLLPAALYAIANDARVIVSTNTINLQEQLLEKDVPMVFRALESLGADGAKRLRATQLKGRSNYLCVRNLLAMKNLESPSVAEARMVAKLLVWLRTTKTGDRAELNLGRYPFSEPWARVSAQGLHDCGGINGGCFHRAARDRAAASHLVVVNHALLMSHIAAEGSVLPPHDVLVIDEAHHLEASATSHFGKRVSQSGLSDHLDSIVGNSGLIGRVSAMVATRDSSDSLRQRAQAIADDALSMSPVVRTSITDLFVKAGRLADESSKGKDGAGRQGEDMRVTTGTRAQPAWSELEAAWERLDVGLTELSTVLTSLGTILTEDASLRGDMLSPHVGLINLTQQLNADNDACRVMLRDFFPHPERETVHWITTTKPTARRAADVTLNSAPLSVGDALEEHVYTPTRAVVLTSATLASEGSLSHLVDRTGFDHARHLIVGSPFDYERAALICLPEDMPEPNSRTYHPRVAETILEAATVVGGRTMALFTSYAAMRDADRAVRSTLLQRDIQLFTQGTDGTPRQIVERFLQTPRSLIFGTASFWEGVDLAGENLQVLLVARLPFAVPTEPITEARAELFDNPFTGYHVPEAVIKLRQGFGRLIRTGSDRGVVVLLDRRVLSMRYGRSFLQSLPPAGQAEIPLADVPSAISSFLGVST